MKININDSVRVKLLPAGIAILKKSDQGWRLTHGINKPTPDGWSRWQLWDLMSVFGPHIHMGFEVPFETEIEIL